jgi:hypothetical protein
MHADVLWQLGPSPRKDDDPGLADLRFLHSVSRPHECLEYHAGVGLRPAMRFILSTLDVAGLRKRCRPLSSRSRSQIGHWRRFCHVWPMSGWGHNEVFRIIVGAEPSPISSTACARQDAERILGVPTVSREPKQAQHQGWSDDGSEASACRQASKHASHALEQPDRS